MTSVGARPDMPPAGGERERRARRAVEHALLAGLVASLGTCLLLAVDPLGRVAAGVGPPSAEGERWTVDLATAPAWELTLVPGIGDARARAIVSDRARDDGPGLCTWDDLLAVPGIGPGLLRRFADPRLPVRVTLHGRLPPRPSDAKASPDPSVPRMGP